MYCIPNWKWKAISALIIYVAYCQAIEQEIGENCTNKNGIVGLCQFKHKCSNINNLNVTCNSEQSIICCATTILKNKQNFNSSNNQKEDRSVQSRFGFVPDFFHAPIPSQNPIPNFDFFNNQRQNLPNYVSNNYQHNSNAPTSVENRPIQNVNQDSSTIFHSMNNNKNIGGMFDRDHTTKRTTRRPQNENYETQRPNKNSNNNYPDYQPTHNNGIPNYITQRPNQNQNENFNRPNYETNTENQNYNNNNYFQNSNQPSHNGIPNYITQRPNQNQNENFNRPNYERYTENQNYNNYNYFLNSNQHTGNNQPNHAPYELNQNTYYHESSGSQRPIQNQNNNFDKVPNYHTSTQKQQNNYRPGNNGKTTNSYGYEENRRPNQNINHQLDTSSVVFPDRTTNDKPYTTFTTTTKKYEYQNRPYENGNTKRISEIKCEEYSKPLTSTISALPLQLNTVPKPVPIEKCSSKSVELIVGGTKAELGEFPHMAAIGFDTTSENPFSCGGTLISERFVLTAAHCTHTALGKPVKVRLGELNLQNNNDGANPIDISVDEIIVHPNYKPTSKYNDIALIRLTQIVKFNNHIRPACLYNNDNSYSTRVTATGWGSIAYGDHSSDDLLKVDLDIINNQQCGKLYEDESKKKTLNKGIVDSMMCAGDLAGGHDTCLGDSGGPLVIRSEKNACIFNLIGVTSFGKFCATENSPGVYTKVSAFVPWIEQIVWS